VINDISFNVHRGETLVIMGGSGCGKSTLLRHIIGSMRPTSGSVKIFGQEITTMNEREIASVRRRFGMLFQSGALLASLTVGENVALPLLQHSDNSVDEIDEIVEEKLQMVGLSGFEDLKPAEISGGMKKRVGLARALALDPKDRLGIALRLTRLGEREAAGSMPRATRSAPPQKCLPLPRNTTTRVAASAARSANCCASALSMAWSKALERSGRSSVIVAIPRDDISTAMPLIGTIPG